MKIGFIIKKSFENIYRRKLNFLMTLSVLIIAFYLLASVFHMFFKSGYYIVETERVLSYKYVLSFNIFLNTNDFGYYNQVRQFDQDLKKKYQDKYARFMYFDASMKNSEMENNTVHMLYVDENSKDLCNAEIIDMKVPEYEEYLKGYVGSNLKQIYPVGTILENVHTGSNMEIVGYINQKSKWISEPPLVTQNATVELDNYILSDMDERYFELYPMFYGNIFNSMYIKCESEDEANLIKEEVRKLAEERGIICYCQSIKSLIEKENNGNRQYLEAMGYLIVFTFIMAMSAYYTASIADTYSRQYDLGVMHLQNVSYASLYGMFLTENLIKCGIAFFISMAKYGIMLKDADLIVFKYMVCPVMIIIVIFLIVSASFNEYRVVKNKGIIMMLGGNRR